MDGSWPTKGLKTATIYRNGRAEALPNLPYSIHHASLTVYKGTVRLCGGIVDETRLSSDCLQFSIFNTLQWEKSGTLPQYMHDHRGVQVLDDMWAFNEDHIYVVPQTGNVTVIRWPHETSLRYSCAQTNGVITIVLPNQSKDVYINLNATTPQSWIKLAKLPAGLEWRSCFLMGSTFYVTGGWIADSNTYSKETYVIDIEKEGSVQRVGDLLAARRTHSMGVVDGAPAVFGGWNGKKYVEGTEIYDTATKKWRSSRVKMVTPSARIASISFAVN